MAVAKAWRHRLSAGVPSPPLSREQQRDGSVALAQKAKEKEEREKQVGLEGVALPRRRHCMAPLPGFGGRTCGPV